MWLFTKIGFFSGTRADFESPLYSAMPRPKDWKRTDYIMVRARVESDLVRLCERYTLAFDEVPPEIFRMPGHDYPCRALMPHVEWEQLVMALVHDIDYSNFKDAVKDNALTPEDGKARYELYLKVWSVMHDASSKLASLARKARARARAIGQRGFNYWQDYSAPVSAPDPEPLLEQEYLYRRDEELPEGTHETYDPADPFHCDDGPLDPEAFEMDERFNAMFQTPERELPRRFNTKPAKRRGR